MNHADGLPAELQRPIKPPVPLTEDKVVFRTVISIYIHFSFIMDIRY